MFLCEKITLVAMLKKSRGGKSAQAVRKTNWKSITIIRKRLSAKSHQGGGGGSTEKWLDSGPI